jgi:hypothetical protein
LNEEKTQYEGIKKLRDPFREDLKKEKPYNSIED